MDENRDEHPHHVEGWGRLPVSKAGLTVFLGERDDGSLAWSTGRPRPFPSRAAAAAALAALGDRAHGLLVSPGTERVVPA